jgi:hypothetical protein
MLEPSFCVRDISKSVSRVSFAVRSDPDLRARPPPTKRILDPGADVEYSYDPPVATRTMMSVGDIPCKRPSVSIRNKIGIGVCGATTHIDLRRDGHEDGLRGVRDRE